MVTRVRLSVRDFALPSPLTGSIESDSGYYESGQVGIEIHSVIQEMRHTAYPMTYESEVKIGGVFLRDEFEFVVEGRMDGVFKHRSTPKIEEIKSTFSLHDLANRLKNDEKAHPYRLQLLTYGYLYQKQYEVKPDLSFLLVSSRNRETSDLTVNFDEDGYSEWLDRRLGELVAQAKIGLKRMQRRKKISSHLPFPFPSPRKGQMELISEIQKGILERNKMLIQAPTGLGKTVGVLYPILKEALERGRSVIYATPKNSQHRVAEDAVEKFQDHGAKLKSITFTAKQKLCLKAEPLCNPQYCEYAKDYYDKLSESKLVEQLSKKRKLVAQSFLDLGLKYQICPFELQLEAVAEADVVICDYNYVFAKGSALKRARELDVGGEGKRSLVMDEVHNLPGRAMSYYSPELTVFTLERMSTEMAFLAKRFAREGQELVSECIEIIQKFRPKDLAKSVAISMDPEPFYEQDAKLRAFLVRYLESDLEIQSKDPVLGLCFYWGGFTEMLEFVSGSARPEFFSLYLKEGGVKIGCADASEMLRSTYSEFENVVGFSATLKPFDYYAKLSGLEGESLRTAEFESPFNSEMRKIILIPQVSTRYQDRDRNYLKIAQIISRVTALKSGNYLAFFPSFDFLKKVSQVVSIPEGYRLFLQERNTPLSQVEDILHLLRSEGPPTILFAVQGGVYSEGVDYPGSMAIGVFVVGPPLPTFDVEREKMREYYDNIFSKGFDYAYTFPAMAKAIQSAGRVIRTESDRGVIILLDPRFLEPSYSKSMPADWFQRTPKELVSTQILKDLEEFWAQS